MPPPGGPSAVNSQLVIEGWGGMGLARRGEPLQCVGGYGSSCESVVLPYYTTPITEIRRHSKGGDLKRGASREKTEGALGQSPQRSGFLRGRDPRHRTRPPGRSVAGLFTHPEGREVGRSPAIPRTLVTVSNGQ